MCVCVCVCLSVFVCVCGRRRYADRAKSITVTATKNEETSQLAALSEEILQLRAKLQEAVSAHTALI